MAVYYFQSEIADRQENDQNQAQLIAGISINANAKMGRDWDMPVEARRMISSALDCTMDAILESVFDTEGM